jgi:hypothetical protein
MAGFLNPKERFVDIQLTQEGKKQLAQGKIRIEYASFSDAGTFYTSLDQFDSGSFTSLNVKKLNFEAASRPQDTIIYESDDSGLLKFKTFLGLSGSRDTIKVTAGQVFSTLSGAIAPLSSSLYETYYAPLILSRSFQNLKDLQILESPSYEDTGYSFGLSANEVRFDITRNAPFDINKDVFEIDINQADSMFVDKRLSHLPNFKFLPPTNKRKTNGTKTQLGTYVNFGEQEKLNAASIKEELFKTEKLGLKKTIEFSDTTKSNTIIGQIIEVNGGVFRKLDVIDFGEETIDGDSKHIYFVGKLYLDNNNVNTFINLFTLVFEGTNQ